ncbi:MAG: MmgE/PrpD family protein [Alphaproteobacteria bacterium]|nr:MmgE/PrpD family protein [Alphaproteobacteria bacterium]
MSDTAMGSSGPTARLAHWAADAPRLYSETVQRAAIAGLRDVIGVILAGANEPTPRNVSAAVAGWGQGKASVIGTTEKLTAPWAALVNGAAAHVLDYDDTFMPLSGHAAAVLAPAVLAAAEEQGSSGADVIDAFVIGLEIMARIGRVVNPKHYALGWHSTATVGVLGAAIGCGRLMRLDARQMSDALSLAVSMAAGTRMQLGAPAKSVHAGLAAKGGVLAAQMARAGVGGTDEALVGRWRFAEMYAGVAPDADAIWPPGPNESFAIEAIGLSFKPYPTCAATHLTLDAVLELRTKHGFKGEDVAAIDTLMPAVLARNLMHVNPRTGMEARFSMHYTAALAAQQGRVALADFEGEAIFRPEVRAIMPRITMRAHPGSENAGDGTTAYPTETRITLRDGRTLEQSRVHRRGSPGLPMSEAEQAAKFEDCAGKVLPAAQVARAAKAIDDLASLAHVGELIAALTPAPMPTRH